MQNTDKGNDCVGMPSQKVQNEMRRALTIDLPISAQELELRLHSFCDHYGWNYKVVGSEYSKAATGEYAMRLLLQDIGTGSY